VQRKRERYRPFRRRESARSLGEVRVVSAPCGARSWW
jgi:hypothetical protein